ncbi:MAG: hypothetical protein J6P44_02435 [Bacteroidales bacterium]|nr:hypothetical protein [Bacteroidales bacterium]
MRRKTITIYYKINGIIQTLTVKFGDSDYIQKEIMQASFVSLNFSLPEYIELPIGSWVEEDNETYYLLDLCQPTKHNSEYFDYSLTFYNTVGLFSNWIVQSYSDDNWHSIKFSLTGRPKDFLTHIVKSCNAHITTGEQEFSIGDYDDASEQLVSFDSTFVFDALNSIAGVFNTEWYVTSDRRICLKKLENTPDDVVTLKYGSGFGIKPNIERRNTEQRRIDRILVQGGDRNIVQTKYGSQYLLLPKKKELYYDGTDFYSAKEDDTSRRKYVSDAEGLSIKGQDYDNNAIHSEMGFDGSNTYPSRVGQITKVTWSPNDSNTEYNSYKEADSHNSEDEKGLVWCNIYDDKNDIDYSDEDLRAEGTETISFMSGKLAGRTIEVSNYEHSKHEFKLMRITDGGVNMPNDTFYPAVDDEYAVFGMQMPQSYVDTASLEMMKEAIKQMYEYELDQVLFSLPIDEIWYKQSGKNLNVGDNINYEDDDFAKTGLKIRITQIRQYLSNPYKIEITLSNCRREQTVKQQIKDFWNFRDNFDSLVTDRVDFYDRTGNGTDKGTALNNKCWVVMPFTPYYKNDEWLVASDTTVETTKFKAGVTYHCKKTRLTGNFTASDWTAKSLFDYDRFDNRPKINGSVLTGDRSLLPQGDFDSFLIDSFDPLKLQADDNTTEIGKRLLGTTFTEFLTGRFDPARNDIDALIGNGGLVPNQCWVVQPTPPYYKNDEWLVARTVTINGMTFYAGVTYICTLSRLTGDFYPSEWLPKSIYNFDNLNGRPKINGSLLSSSDNLLLLPQGTYDTFLSTRFTPVESNVTRIIQNRGDIPNKCWVVQPTVPYYANDEWLVSEKVTIGGKDFLAGCTYLCTVDRTTGSFTASDWQLKSVTSYDDLRDKPTIITSYNDLTDKPIIITSYRDLTDKPSLNGVVLSGDIDLSNNSKFSSLVNDYGTLRANVFDTTTERFISLIDVRDALKVAREDPESPLISVGEAVSSLSSSISSTNSTVTMNKNSFDNYVTSNNASVKELQDNRVIDAGNIEKLIAKVNDNIIPSIAQLDTNIGLLTSDECGNNVFAKFNSALEDVCDSISSLKAVLQRCGTDTRIQNQVEELGDTMALLKINYSYNQCVVPSQAELKPVTDITPITQSISAN